MYKFKSIITYLPHLHVSRSPSNNRRPRVTLTPMSWRCKASAILQRCRWWAQSQRERERERFRDLPKLPHMALWNNRNWHSFVQWSNDPIPLAKKQTHKPNGVFGSGFLNSVGSGGHRVFGNTDVKLCHGGFGGSGLQEWNTPTHTSHVPKDGREKKASVIANCDLPQSQNRSAMPNV